MKKGDLVRVVAGEPWEPWVGVVLEVRTSPAMTIFGGHFREERTEIKVWCSKKPRLSEYFSNAEFFEVISEAK